MRTFLLISAAAFCAAAYAQAPAALRPPNTTTPPPKPAAAAAKPAAPKPAPRMNVAALLNPAGLTAKAPDTYKVKFVTTKGELVVQVTRAWSPLGADRFWNLVRNGFYNDATFFRVLPGFVAQFGLSANPAVNAAWQNARIQDDASTVQSNKRGTLSFATSGPNSRTTQIFINYGDNARLDTIGFTAFGVILDNGMEIADKIFSGYAERPSQGRIKTCLQKQMNLLEALGRDMPYVKEYALSSICDEVVHWPHRKVRDALKLLYGFTCDYPGVRHGGKPGSVLGELGMRDLLALCILFIGFTPYLSGRIDADAIFPGL